jgi:serine/threonine protein kinase/formylglycine-generating enzyme required for sulfatase activity
MNDLSGSSFGRYHLVEKLGEGGMAVVYKAFDTRLECDVAVKVIRLDNLPRSSEEIALKRFEREAKSVAQLTHPNIVKVSDFGEEDGLPYLVMPFLPGGTLKQFLGKPMPYSNAAHLLQPMADALAYAHLHNVIHRDVKPSNILITELGQPMLTDFGIAKIMDLQDGQTLTGTGVGIGTPEYMAPEQWTGDITPSVDIYSLGVVFYELVTGHKPYTADTPAAILIKQATDPLPKPSSFVSDLPESVEHVLYKALAKKPEDRFVSMTDLNSQLKQIDRAQGDASSQLTSSQKIDQTKPIVEEHQLNAAEYPKPPANSMEESHATQLQDSTVKTAMEVTPPPLFEKKPDKPIKSIEKNQLEPFIYRDVNGKTHFGKNSFGRSWFILILGWAIGSAASYGLYAFFDYYTTIYLFGAIICGIVGGVIIGEFSILSLNNSISLTKKQKNLIWLSWVMFYITVSLIIYYFRGWFYRVYWPSSIMGILGIVGGYLNSLLVIRDGNKKHRDRLFYTLAWAISCLVTQAVYMLLIIPEVYNVLIWGSGDLDLQIWLFMSILIPAIAGAFIFPLLKIKSVTPDLVTQFPFLRNNQKAGLISILALIALILASLFANNYTNLMVKQPNYHDKSSDIVSSKDNMTMSYVPSQSFLMGSQTFRGEADEHPLHNVFVDAFYIDQYEVTNAMYEKCVISGECEVPVPGQYDDSYYGESKYDDYPVVNVTWYQAQQYCQWAGKRLPTEAEWELAAKKYDNYTFPWGNDIFHDSNKYVSGHSELYPVGSYPNGVSPFGLYDMAGNAWEWVSDWYSSSYYSRSPYKNPQGPDKGTEKVRKSGGIMDDFFKMRSANKGRMEPLDSNDETGFRCVKDANTISESLPVEPAPTMTPLAIKILPTATTVSLPDLQVTGLSISPSTCSIIWGSPTTVPIQLSCSLCVTVANTGDSIANNVEIEIYGPKIYIDHVSPGDTATACSAGFTFWYMDNSKVKSPATAWARVDPNNSIIELNEDNNYLQKSIYVDYQIPNQ